MNVVVTGTLGFDYIMNFSGRFADRIMPDKIHNISLSFLVDKLSKQFGGTAGNIAYTLKLFGLTPYIVSSAGNDFDEYSRFLTKHKISTKYISLHKNIGTGSYFVVTDKDDNQIGSFYTGATKYARKLTIGVTGKPDFVIIAPTDPEAMRAYVRECRKESFPYMYDPAFQIGNFTDEDLREGIDGSKILIGNDYEIALIEDKLKISHDELRTLVPVLITTLGPKGSIVETRYESIYCKPAKPEINTDPTGAGDAYRAGFIAGFIKGLDLGICGQLGSLAAVYTVEQYGTQTHTFTLNEFKKRYYVNFGSIPQL